MFEDVFEDVNDKAKSYTSDNRYYVNLKMEQDTLSIFTVSILQFLSI